MCEAINRSPFWPVLPFLLQGLTPPLGTSIPSPLATSLTRTTLAPCWRGCATSSLPKIAVRIRQNRQNPSPLHQKV